MYRYFADRFDEIRKLLTADARTVALAGTGSAVDTAARKTYISVS